MIVVINFLVKIIASCILGITVWFYMVVALIMWNGKFMDIPNQSLKLIWDKPKN